MASIPSEKHKFTEKDAEIEHLRAELEIQTQKVETLMDFQRQVGTLGAQLEASKRSNLQQLKVNEQQARLIEA